MEISAPTLTAVNKLGMWKPEPPSSQPGCEPQMSDLWGKIKNNRCSDGARKKKTKEEPHAAINSPVQTLEELLGVGRSASLTNPTIIPGPGQIEPTSL